jgi:hypothetical protein
MFYRDALNAVKAGGALTTQGSPKTTQLLLLYSTPAQIMEGQHSGRTINSRP